MASPLDGLSVHSFHSSNDMTLAGFVTTLDDIEYTARGIRNESIKYTEFVALLRDYWVIFECNIWEQTQNP